MAGIPTNKKDPITESVPFEWTAEQEIIAKDALAVLVHHYHGYKWGVEWTTTINGQLGGLLLRLLDVPTTVSYLVNPKDFDRDRMRCVVRGGGTLLEALGLKAGHARGWDVRDAKRTAAGLIIPDYNAMPERNPGYNSIKKQFNALRAK